MNLRIPVLVMMLFLTACEANNIDDPPAGNVGPESVGAAPQEVAAAEEDAPPEVAAAERCAAGTRVYMSIQDPDVLSAETRGTDEAHREGWIALHTVEEGREIQGQVQPNKVRVVKAIDSSSVVLRRELARGIHFNEVRIEVETECQKPVVVYQAIMSDAVLTSIQIETSAGQDELVESFTWDYMHLKMTYTSIGDDGRAEKPISSSKYGRLYWR
jgi:type VI protein secretion system component Hcp